MSHLHNYPAKSNRVCYHRTSLSSYMIQVEKHSRDNSDNDTPHDLHLSLEVTVETSGQWVEIISFCLKSSFQQYP